MRSFLSTRIILLAVSSFAVVVLRAQDANEAAVEATRIRIERAIARQKDSVRGMAESVAAQERAAARQRASARVGDFTSYTSQFGRRPVPAACDSLPGSEIDALVETAAKRTAVAPELIRSVMQQESAFHSCAVSPKGAIGLMQLEPATAVDLGVKDLFDPEANVLGGARLLKQLMDRYGGDLPLALGAYNAGAARVDAAGGVPKIPETLDYVSRIVGMLSKTNLMLGSKTQNGIRAVPGDSDNAPSTNFWLTDSEGGK